MLHSSTSSSFFLFQFSMCSPGQVASTGQSFPPRNPDWSCSLESQPLLSSLQAQTLHSSLYCFSWKVLVPSWALSKTLTCSFNVTELGNYKIKYKNKKTSCHSNRKQKILIIWYYHHTARVCIWLRHEGGEPYAPSYLQCRPEEVFQIRSWMTRESIQHI